MTDLNILIINICIRPDSDCKLFPLGLAYITTAIDRAGYKFDLLDIDVERLSAEEIEIRLARRTYDVVAMGCIVTGYKFVKDLAAKIRDIHPYSKIIVGNSVATSIYELLLKNTEVDIAVLGEGEATITVLLQTLVSDGELREVHGIAFMNGKHCIKTKDRLVIKNLGDLFWADFSPYDVETYIDGFRPYISEPYPIPLEKIRALPVNFARGCYMNCNFCYHNFQGTGYRKRSDNEIVTRIEYLQEKYGINYIYFYDEVTFANSDQAKRFAKAVLESGLEFYWAGNCRAGAFKKDEDIEVLHLLKEAGCIGLTYSLESGDEEILKAMNKKMKVEDFNRQCELFNKANMPIWTCIVVGYPQESPKTIKKTFDVCIQNGVYPSIGYLLPQPGSIVYEYALENNYIANEEEYLLKLGDRQELRVNMTGMINEEMEECVLKNALRCKNALGLDLEMMGLIKSKTYKSITEI